MRAFLIAALVAAFSFQAQAEPTSRCVPREQAVAFLAEKFQEVPAALGLVPTAGHVAELFLSQQGSWTIVITRPDGTSCILASGSNWENLQMKEGEKS